LAWEDRLVIDLRYVKKLLEMIDASSVNSIEITSEKGVKIRISKSARGPVRGADAVRGRAGSAWPARSCIAAAGTRARKAGISESQISRGKIADGRNVLLRT
jgi:hypothetical protein